MAKERKWLKIDKFDRNDFESWKMQVVNYMYQIKMNVPIKKKSDAMPQENWELLNRKGLGAVRLTLAKSIVYNVTNEETTFDVMKMLSDMYEKSSANKIYLIIQLVTSRMKEDRMVTIHINKFSNVLSRLMFVSKFEDKIQSLFLLSSLPKNWDATVKTINNSSTNTKIT